MSVVHGLIHAARALAVVTLPALVAIVPSSGTNAGSTHVVIQVADSTGCVSAAIDGINLTSFAIDDGTHVSGDTVAHAVGACDVTVTNGDGTSAPLAAAYSYAAAFDPTVPSGLKVWLDATDLTQAGTVTAITEKAGSGAVVTITGGQEPGYTASNANYANAPTFDFLSGSPAVKITNHGLTTGAFTVVFVGDGTNAAFWMQDANGTSIITAGGGSGNKHLMSSDAGTYLVGTVVESGVPGVSAFVFNGASSKIYDSAHTADASGNAGTLQDLTGVQLVIGNAASPSSGGKMAGSIRHFLLYSGALSPSDIADLLDGAGSESGLSIGV